MDFIENPKPARRLGDLVDLPDGDPDADMIVAIHTGPNQGMHGVVSPNTPGLSDEYVRLWSFWWYPCQRPGRPSDEAMIFETRCAECSAEWDRRGCPLDVLPSLPAGAEVMRQVVGVGA